MSVPEASGALPVLYLMAPMTLYGSAALAAARRYPFSELTGCRVRVECADGMFGDTASWAAAWPALRHRYSCGVFLDHLGGWVSRGLWCEVTDLLGLGRPAWWLSDAGPRRWFGFGPPDNTAWAYRYRSVFPVPQPQGAR